jgi:hypothetical protein
MELAGLQGFYAEYRIKTQCLKHPARCAELRPQSARLRQINALNGRLAALPADEFRAFLARVNRNPANVAFVADRFDRLQRVIAAEQRCLDEGRGEELARLLAEDVALFRQICREVRDHYACGVQVEVIGYGEITTSLVLSDQVSLDHDLRPQAVPSRWVYKSLPKFPSPEEVGRYERAFYEYSDLLRRAGLDLPEQKLAVAGQDAEGIKIYIALPGRRHRADQPRGLPQEHSVLHAGDHPPVLSAGRAGPLLRPAPRAD